MVCRAAAGETNCRFWISLAAPYIDIAMSNDPALIIYDGDCIFCQNYVRLVRLRETVGRVEMLDARSGDARVARYWREGYDLNDGMLFVYKGKIYHGSDAIHVLAGLSSPVSWFNHFNRAVFASRTASTLLYPILKFGRRVTLLARGKRLLSKPNPIGQSESTRR
jgi:predicted DCC family thiol-disulfide oxidoreductase YuxK